MANTYTQVHIQFVFAVKHRENIIHHSWENELYKYITGIVQKHNHKMISINGMPDHIHILIGLKPPLKGEMNKLSKRIYQKDKDGKIINEFPSRGLAIENNNLCVSSMGKILNGTRRSTTKITLE